VIPLPGLPPALAAGSAAAQLRSLSTAIRALADVEWQSPAGDAYRAVVAGIAADAALLAARLEAQDP
jgi:hypothetical protein